MTANLKSMISKQAFDLAELQQELKKAFSAVQSQIAVVESSSRSTVGTMATLTTQMSAISGDLAKIQKSLDDLTSQSQDAGSRAIVNNISPCPPMGAVASPAHSRSQSEPNLVSLRPFDGDFNHCWGVLAHCELLFNSSAFKIFFRWV